MTRNLCLVPTRYLGDQLEIILSDDASIITAPIDDDDSAASKARDLIEEYFGIKFTLKAMNQFQYLGEIEHDYQTFSVIHFDMPKNHMADFAKKMSVIFDKNDKEYRCFFKSLWDERPNVGFKFNDSFNLAVALKLLSIS